MFAFKFNFTSVFRIFLGIITIAFCNGTETLVSPTYSTEFVWTLAVSPTALYWTSLKCPSFVSGNLSE